jgi:peptide/nickel transport system substrate-binding protein
VNSLHSEPRRRISFRSRVNMTIHSFSLSGKLIFYILFFIFAGSALSLLWKINNFSMVLVPARGGSIHEGVVGFPRYINPVLAVTDSDKDISALVYAGLMRATPQGDFVPDLAQNYTLSADGKTYTFVLRPNLYFSDGKPITVDDIVYTIQQIQNPTIKSPRFANWNGVIVNKVDDSTVTFTLSQPYSPFLENLTVGILPKHIWQKTSGDSFALSNLNTNPTGEGPYVVNAIKKNGNGIPDSYELTANSRYSGSKALINTITFNFYSTEKDLETGYQNGEIDGMNGISPNVAKTLERSGSKVYVASLPRVFGVFFNQTDNTVLSSSEVRQALDISVNRDYIVSTVLQSYGTALMGPVPERFIGKTPTATSTSYEDLVGKANALLDKAGWVTNADGIREKKLKTGTTTLAFAISTSDSQELKDVADILKSEWRRIGVSVDIKVFEGGNLNQSVIRPRKYDALLFGQIVNRDLDLYAFWHSSQKTDPGLNIALYTNPKADKLLETLRIESNKDDRIATYNQFQDILKKDIPAVFLYSPDFIYVASPEVKNIVIDNLSTPSERFNGVSSWYIDTERVWKIFAR